MRRSTFAMVAMLMVCVLMVTVAAADAPLFGRQTEKAVRQLANNPKPQYPASLRATGAKGQVVAKFLVDTLGRAVASSFKVIKSDNPLFTESVQAVLPSLRFSPAEVDGRKVAQLIQMPFAFAPPR